MIDKDKLLARLEVLMQNPTTEGVIDLMDEIEGWCAPHRRLDTETTPSAVDRYYELRERAKAQGLTLGLYLYRTDALPAKGEVGTFRLRLAGPTDETLTESLTIIQTEIEWYENRPTLAELVNSLHKTPAFASGECRNPNCAVNHDPQTGTPK